MKEKKVNWFTKNSNWLFIVFLIAGIVLVNVIFNFLKKLFNPIYGFQISTNWPYLLLILFYFIVFVFLVLFLYFLIYLEDYLHDRNKRKFRMYDALINKIIPKGEKIEKK